MLVKKNNIKLLIYKLSSLKLFHVMTIIGILCVAEFIYFTIVIILTTSIINITLSILFNEM